MKGLSGFWNAVLMIAVILALAIVYSFFAQGIVSGITSLGEALKVLLSSGPMLLAMGVGAVGLYYFAMYLQRHSGRIDRKALGYIAMIAIAWLYLWKGWQFAVVNFFGRPIEIPDSMFTFLVSFFAGIFSATVYYGLKRKGFV
jgi:hypothetical protein